MIVFVGVHSGVSDQAAQSIINRLQKELNITRSFLLYHPEYSADTWKDDLQQIENIIVSVSHAQHHAHQAPNGRSGGRFTTTPLQKPRPLQPSSTTTTTSNKGPLTLSTPILVQVSSSALRHLAELTELTQHLLKRDAAVLMFNLIPPASLSSNPDVQDSHTRVTGGETSGGDAVAEESDDPSPSSSETTPEPRVGCILTVDSRSGSLDPLVEEERVVSQIVRTIWDLSDNLANAPVLKFDENSRQQIIKGEVQVTARSRVLDPKVLAALTAKQGGEGKGPLLTAVDSSSCRVFALLQVTGCNQPLSYSIGTKSVQVKSGASLDGEQDSPEPSDQREHVTAVRFRLLHWVNQPRGSKSPATYRKTSGASHLPKGSVMGGDCDPNQSFSYIPEEMKSPRSKREHPGGLCSIQ